MGTEIDMAFELLQAALEQRPAKVVAWETSQWWSLFRLLQKNHVAALCFDTLPSGAVGREVLVPWLAEREKAADWYRHQERVQEEVRAVMQEHGIETLVLKGTHLAQYYPCPERREFGDLDFYFYDRHDEADEVARRKWGVTITGDSHHHTKYNYHGVTIESHYDFLNTHYPRSNRRYEALLKELAPSPTFEVLFLLRHMAGHFAASRITLRDLADWSLICRALNDKVDWELVECTAADYGMVPFYRALNATLATQDADRRFVHNIVYGDIQEHPDENMGRLLWKLRRWQKSSWKRHMSYGDSELSLLLASLTSHAEKPRSILHKQ